MMKVIAFLTDYAVVDRIINHLMVGWENGDKDEPSAGSTENQIPSMMM
jgi:hypothetical protein